MFEEEKARVIYSNDIKEGKKNGGQLTVGGDKFIAEARRSEKKKKNENEKNSGL